MRVTRIRFDARSDEWHYLTPLSDLHLDAYASDLTAFKTLVKERNELPNHRWIGIGDLGDWILPKDPKRYQPSTAQERLRGRDAYVNETLDFHAEMLRDVSFDLVGLGNHETAVIQHHAVDVIDLLCKRLGTRYGGYSGFLQYELVRKGRVNSTFTVLYHHGRGGGRVVKGFGWLRDWARAFDGWDVVVAGHNHYAVAHREVRMGPRQRMAEAQARDVSLVFCGTHLRGYVDKPGGGPSYEEIAGHAPVAICSPLISFRSRRRRDRAELKAGLPENWIEHRVTL